MHMLSDGTLLFVLVAGIAHLNCQIVIIFSQASTCCTQDSSFLGRTSWLGGESGSWVTTSLLWSHIWWKLGDFQSLSCDLWWRFPAWEIGGFSWNRWVLSEQFGGAGVPRASYYTFNITWRRVAACPAMPFVVPVLVPGCASTSTREGQHCPT